MKKIDISSLWMGQEPPITDELISYYRQNPQELDLIIDKESFHSRFLGFFFVLGLGITLGARLLTYLFGGAWGAFFNDVVLDVASELGIAIFGGAVTAYFLEFLQKKQYDQNMRFRERVKARMKEG